jgi:hypothetical protein
MKELIQQLEAAVLRRNPGIAAAFQPGLPPEQIRKDLKRAGIRGDVEPLVELYCWRNGAKSFKESEAYEQGFAPPVISTLDQAHIDFMRGLGHKFDPHKRLYDAYNFSEFQGGLWHVKHWKKFSRTNPKLVGLVGRYFPFMANKAGDSIALDVHPEAHHRVVIVTKDNDVCEAYDSFEEFLKDLIHANETGELLACVQSKVASTTASDPTRSM